MPVMREANGMTDWEQLTMLINNSTDLQRINVAVDKDKEIK